MDQRELTEGLLQSLAPTFAERNLVTQPVVTQLRKRQTNAFRPGSIGCQFEVDHVIRLAAA
jgi:hypothetical protein